VARGKPRRALPPWGENVQRLLRNAGLTSRGVAQKIGMSEQQFSDLVNDPESNPEYKQLQRLAEGIGVEVAALFDLKEAHGSKPAAAPDPETLRTAVRAALGDVLADLLVALGKQSTHPDESHSGARAHETKHGDLSSRRR